MSQGRFKLSQQVKDRAREDSGCVVDCAEMKVSLMCWYGMCMDVLLKVPQVPKISEWGAQTQKRTIPGCLAADTCDRPRNQREVLGGLENAFKTRLSLGMSCFCTFFADFFPFWFLSVSAAIVLACRPKKSSLSKLRLHHRSVLHEALIFWYDHRINSILQEIQEEAFQGRLFRLKPVLQFCKKGTSRERSR